MDRFRTIQLTVFAAIAAVVLVVGSVVYVKLPQLMGLGQYYVDVQLARTGGLYPKAPVTYRGVDIGQVSDIAVDPTGGVVATLRLDSGTPVPTDAIASVNSTSGIGEQYLQLAPQRRAGPYLEDGAVIPERMTRLPVTTDALLRDVQTLLASVPSPELKNLLDESYLATRGVGDDVGRLLSSSQLLVSSLRDNLPSTITLVQDLQPVLATQVRNEEATRTFTRDFSAFTEQLRLSDADLRGLLDQAPPTLRETTGLVNELRPTVPLLLANLTSVGQIVRIYLPGVEQVLVVYPQFTTFLQSILTPDPGNFRLQARLQVNDPPPCMRGFDPNLRSPAETETPPPDPAAHCTEGRDFQSAVRGARNIPCPNGDGRAFTPEACGVDTRPYGISGGPYTGEGAPYDNSTGIFIAPDGQYYRLARGPSDHPDHQARPASTTTREDGWRALMLNGATT